jgi:hypothetical protein
MVWLYYDLILFLSEVIKMFLFPMILGVEVSPLRKTTRENSIRQGKKREVQEVSDKLESLLLGVRQAKSKFARFEAALRE